MDAIALLGTWAWKIKAKDRDLGGNGSSAKEAKALFGLMPLQKQQLTSSKTIVTMADF